MGRLLNLSMNLRSNEGEGNDIDASGTDGEVKLSRVASTKTVSRLSLIKRLISTFHVRLRRLERKSVLLGLDLQEMARIWMKTMTTPILSTN
jgi:hypothetical protein